MTEFGILVVVVLVALAVAIRSMQRIMKLVHSNKVLIERLEKLEKNSVVLKDFHWLVERVDYCETAVTKAEEGQNFSGERINFLGEEVAGISRAISRLEQKINNSTE